MDFTWDFQNKVVLLSSNIGNYEKNHSFHNDAPAGYGIAGADAREQPYV